jgi:hypothetical protein
MFMKYAYLQFAEGQKCDYITTTTWIYKQFINRRQHKQFSFMIPIHVETVTYIVSVVL